MPGLVGRVNPSTVHPPGVDQVPRRPTEPIGHATYQLKGKSLEVRASTDEERAFQQRWAEANIGYLRPMWPPHLIPKLEGFAQAPSTYLRFRVEEIYDQTPGPTAGKRIPLEE